MIDNRISELLNDINYDRRAAWERDSLRKCLGK